MVNYCSWIEIDLKQFKKNISIVRSYIGNTLLCITVKANAYGHGLIEMSKVAQDQKVDYLAVANLLEGIKLRNENINLPILVLGIFHEDQISELIDYDLEITISSFFKAKLVKDYCSKYNKKCKVHLKIDTGLRRIGIRPETGIELYKYLKNEDCFILKGIFSHFACSPEPNHPMNDLQLKAFENFIENIKPDKSVLCHIANTGAICNIKNSFKDMVRLGALPFGCYTKKVPKELSEIKPIFSVKSKVSFFKVVQKDEGISYGHTYITKNQTRIVTIPIGYGDGFPRKLSNRGQVLIGGKRYPIVGIICMDQFMVDIGNDSAFIGDEVVLIGKQKNEKIEILEISNLCETISYEILCSFNERLPRVYIN
jgi:alanine racemase